MNVKKISFNSRDITGVNPFNSFLLSSTHNVQQCNGNYANFSTHNNQCSQPVMSLFEIFSEGRNICLTIWEHSHMTSDL
jgi:hypothetical protein